MRGKKIIDHFVGIGLKNQKDFANFLHSVIPMAPRVYIYRCKEEERNYKLLHNPHK